MSLEHIEPAERLRFPAAEGRGEVSALLLRPASASRLLVLGHGAGAGMTHPFLRALAERLAAGGIATLRYLFPYMEAAERSGSRRRPDPAPVLEATVRSAVATARRLEPDLPLFAGGKSMGGRMTSRAQSQRPLSGVRGLIFFGFPLHPAGKPATERGDHLAGIRCPMLFLQGTRDSLAGLDLVEPLVRRLGPHARLHAAQGCDHSFHVLKRSGRTDADVLDELAEATIDWTGTILGDQVS